MLSLFTKHDLLPLIFHTQAPLSMGFSQQEQCSGLPCPPSGYLPNPGIEPRSSTWWADSLPFEPPGKPFKCMRIAKVNGFAE